MAHPGLDPEQLGCLRTSLVGIPAVSRSSWKGRRIAARWLCASSAHPQPTFALRAHPRPHPSKRWRCDQGLYCAVGRCFAYAFRPTREPF
jgi:hypothetical protein